MANAFSDTETSIAEPDTSEFDGDELITYLREQNVKLTSSQIEPLIEMELSLKDLANMNIETDPTTFNELCVSLGLKIAPKLKFRSAIINLRIINIKYHKQGHKESKLEHKDEGKKKLTQPYGHDSVSDDVFAADIDKDSDKCKITVAVIGSVGVGKSSILTRYLDDIFTNDRIQTVGVDVRQKRIEILDTKVTINLLDTAGQERFGTIANWYYRVSHAFIVVYDITNKESFDDLKYWMERLNEKTSDKAVRFVVGTKVDLEVDRKVTFKEGESFAKSMGYRFCEVSSKSGRNVDQIFTTVSLYVIQSGVIQEYEQRNNKGIIDITDRGILSSSMQIGPVNTLTGTTTGKSKGCCYIPSS